MAIFKVPRITTAQRLLIMLEKGEIVFDTDLNILFSGNDVILGGFPIGKGSEPETRLITITQENIDNKSIILEFNPTNPMSVSLVPEGGIPQRNGIDFEVIENELKWQGKGLDGFIELGEIVFLTY